MAPRLASHTCRRRPGPPRWYTPGSPGSAGARCAREAKRSIQHTRRANSARTADWYPEPAPISSTFSLPVSRSELGHGRHDVGLRDRLTLPDGQRVVAVGAVPQGLLDEAVAGNRRMAASTRSSVMPRRTRCSSTIRSRSRAARASCQPGPMARSAPVAGCSGPAGDAPRARGGLPGPAVACAQAGWLVRSRSEGSPRAAPRGWRRCRCPGAVSHTGGPAPIQ